MRPFAIALSSLFLTSLTIHAQQAQPKTETPPAGAAADNPLDQHLQKWEDAMKKVETLGAQLKRIDKDPVFDRVISMVGEAYYMKAGGGTKVENLALMEMRPEGAKDRKEFKEKFICTGTYIYSFLPEQKEIRYYELPKPKEGQVGEDSLLSLLFGMKATEAKNRYELKMAKEDAHYIYVDITPRSDVDKSDFKRARLVLNKSNYLPRQLWFEHANRSEVMWDIPNMQIPMAKLDRRVFDAPKAPPPGWKIVAGENRVQTVRPSSPTPTGK